MSNSNLVCPLCQCSTPRHYHTDERRQFWQCETCSLVFVEPSQRPLPEQEKALYDCHQNDVFDIRYRQFLSRLATPLLARVKPNSSGLDFGCGPGPALAAILTERGHHISVYDPFFAPCTIVLQDHYDFITCTEAIEHFHQPEKEWNTWMTLLKPQGYLGLMTGLVQSPSQFARWHYKLDPTHVSFFSRETFEFLAHRDGLTLEFFGSDAILLQRK
ncbi:class I SAM-dependent methyltransferase [Echinimonas agarilytica]|uniref:Class I SAM-dependent methyltransferase n=1 Tax=Echinimonas agarilytica TaxID=1215918 RepID=A0AA41W473_9GAMM|nr:class I SAM-dependent methyltransferase [Echinimonas agarilytica]MCM2678288.1 class I SAM-dependent methyltransferase [Echinimonas agarilytica]